MVCYLVLVKIQTQILVVYMILHLIVELLVFLLHLCWILYQRYVQGFRGLGFRSGFGPGDFLRLLGSCWGAMLGVILGYKVNMHLRGLGAQKTLRP